MTDFESYIRQGEPGQRERANNWSIAIGLQAVDGLTPSEYLVDLAKQNIEGKVTLDEVRQNLDSYYQSLSSREAAEAEQHNEADRAAANITHCLNAETFTYGTIGLAAIHRAIFTGIYKFAGQFRDYNISKKEWVLNGESIRYASAEEITPRLNYDFEQEAAFLYKNLTMDQVVKHLCQFTANIWETHAFGEGNTRTTAVFIIKYLQKLGFKVENTAFREHSWYFRNALVRANYTNYQYGISATNEYLEKFFRNLLMGENNELKNRYLHIDASKYGLVTEKEKTTPEQAPEQAPEQVSDKLHTNDNNIIRLVKAIGTEELSVTEIMSRLELKHRPNFLEYTLNPSLREGYVCKRYPDKPKHPRQKYMLTIKGAVFYNELVRVESC